MVTLYSGKVELGTGVLTAVTQIAAEELSVPFDRVTTIQGDTALTPDQGPTYAACRSRTAACRSGARRRPRARRCSTRPRASWASRRPSLSCATAWSASATAASPCRTPSSSAIASSRSRSNPAAPLKDPKDYTIVGKPVPRLDIPAKVFGTFDFVQDVKVPGMLHARVVHPAGVRSTLQSFDDTACRKITGYVRAVRKGDFLAVVATNEWAAISASTAIVAKWSDWAGLPDESQLFEYVRNSKVDRNEVLQSDRRYGRRR